MDELTKNNDSWKATAHFALCAEVYYDVDDQTEHLYGPCYRVIGHYSSTQKAEEAKNSVAKSLSWKGYGKIGSCDWLHGSGGKIRFEINPLEQECLNYPTGKLKVDDYPILVI